ncbi:uncharacterized protein LOC135475327 [Liolophura sinensis]|uniref:uncharacterized protein LOC135475327 n=1 Tax=Liolophura sinensis TaxID=3198878 RepID=UPI0031583EC8
MDDAEGDDMEVVETRSTTKRTRDFSTDRSSQEGKKAKQVGQKQGNNNNNVVISSMGGLPVTGWNPIKFGQSLQQAIGNVKQVKKINGKDLMIVCNSATQVKKALSITTLMGRDVSCRLHSNITLSRGVIYGLGEDITEEEVQQALKKYKVTKAQRLTKGKEKTKTKCMLLYFNSDALPEEVSLGYEIFPVKQYVPPAIRCFKCQSFGHISGECRGRQRCPRCGGPHTFDECHNLDRPKCVNCGSNERALTEGPVVDTP